MNVNCPTTTQFSITPSTPLYTVSRHSVVQSLYLYYARRPGAKLSNVGDYSRRAINKTTTFVMGAPAMHGLVSNDDHIIYAYHFIFTHTYIITLMAKHDCTIYTYTYL